MIRKLKKFKVKLSINPIVIAAFILVMLLFSISLGAQDLVINEFLASNNAVILDEDGESSDWIELYNSGVTTLDLEGYTLTDEADDPDQWKFPSVTLAPGVYLLVWASGKDRTDSLSLHTNFKLNAGEEFIGLYSPSLDAVDTLSFGDQTTDISYGRFPDGSDNFSYFSYPTPGSSNKESAPLIAHLTASLPQGVYKGSILVELSTDLAGGEIRYTLDGSEPMVQNSLYQDFLIFTGPSVLRACVYINNEAVSVIETWTYIVNDDPRLPVLSVVTAPENLWGSKTGIYMNYNGRGIEWERLAHLTLIEDGESKFSVPAGIRIHGSSSRKYDKKNFRIYFRSVYGQSALVYPLFSQKDITIFKTLVLYAPSVDQPTANYDFTLIVDALTHSVWHEIGGNISAFRPVSLYLNGAYWGIYWIRERIDKYYIESNFGITDMDYNRAKWGSNKPDVREGDSLYWYETFDFFCSNDISNSENYKLVCEKYIDIDNYTDYHIINIFAANMDWPHNNMGRFRDRTGDPRWKWILWDTDNAWHWRPAYSNTLEWATRNRIRRDIYYKDGGVHLWSTIILRKLLENDIYRNRFINRFADLMNTLLISGNILQRIDELEDMVYWEMLRELKRWGGIHGSVWANNLKKIRNFAKDRPAHQRQHIVDKFLLDGTVNLTILTSVGQGSVTLNSITPEELPWEGIYFSGIPITFRAEPSPGYVFYQWSDTALPAEPEITIKPYGDVEIRAVFAEAFSQEDIHVDALTDSSAEVYWTTDRKARGRVQYGLTESCDRITGFEDEFSQVHTVMLGGLEPDTLYYYMACSTDTLGVTVVSGILTFRTESGATDVSDGVGVVPSAFSVSSNYPNPFNSWTRFNILCAESGRLQIKLYNVWGQEVADLLDERVEAGERFLCWNGRDGFGRDLSSGIYILKVQFHGESGKRESVARRWVVLK